MAGALVSSDRFLVQYAGHRSHREPSPQTRRAGLLAAGVDMVGFTVVSRRQSIGLGMNDGPTIGGVPYQDWAIRRALGLDTQAKQTRQ